jgi:hypothetical protein
LSLNFMQVGKPKPALPADFWSLMPQQLILIPAQAGIFQEFTDLYSFVLETGSTPHCLLSGFSLSARSSGAISLLFKGR